MWQRVQTVFLAVAVISLLASLVFPIWSVDVNGDTTVLTSFYRATGLKGASSEGAVYVYMPYSVTAMLCVAAITLAIMGILKYNNRLAQMKIGALNSFFLVGVILASFYFSNDLIKTTDAGSGSFGLGMWLPGVAVLCNLLANRFIRKDEKLVRDSNRLR
ncbi:DUF4293 domain-containing protein [Chryseolinea sp. T2]|uniref:DUF4293 domain-containing protein n=1 Tax=Chryseolinea sp. T2 TaxID=3129255 RepID=UPI0030788AF1